MTKTLQVGLFWLILFCYFLAWFWLTPPRMPWKTSLVWAFFAATIFVGGMELLVFVVERH